jgi:RNA polymerase sigma factor (sigma-70 family)
MAAPLKADYEDLESSAKIVKFVILKKREEQDATEGQELASFEALILPRSDAAQNLAKWLLCNQENHAVDLTTAFDEEIHVSGHESVSPATILEQSENAELIRGAMDKLPVEFWEILVLRHLEGSSYNEIAEIAQLVPGTIMSRLARARAKPKECLAARIGKEK